MPLVDMLCEDCKLEFEDFHNAFNSPADSCPECKSKNVVTLISMCKTRGKVELTGKEIDQKIKEDVAQMRKRASTDINYRANLIGESKFNKLVK